jgi:hypothetical protein
MLEEGQLKEIGQAALDAAPVGWKTITIEVTGLADTLETASVAETSSGEEGFVLDMDGGIAVMELRGAMHREGVGTWYRATIGVDENKQVTASFDYESKPYEEDEEGSAEVIDLLTQDHELFPRDLEHLPDWHPAKHIAM